MSAGIYQELCDSTISSFLKFMAQRYKSAPVRTAPSIPETQKCPKCDGDMMQRHRTGGNTSKFVRVLWHCAKCTASHWQSYGKKTRVASVAADGVNSRVQRPEINYIDGPDCISLYQFTSTQNS